MMLKPGIIFLNMKLKPGTGITHLIFGSYEDFFCVWIIFQFGVPQQGQLLEASIWASCSTSSV